MKPLATGHRFTSLSTQIYDTHKQALHLNASTQLNASQRKALEAAMTHMAEAQRILQEGSAL